MKASLLAVSCDKRSGDVHSTVEHLDFSCAQERCCERSVHRMHEGACGSWELVDRSSVDLHAASAEIDLKRLGRRRERCGKRQGRDKNRSGGEERSGALHRVSEEEIMIET